MCRLQQIGQARKVLSKFQNKSSSLSLSLSLSLSVCLSVSLYIYLQYTFIGQKRKSHLLRVHHALGCLRQGLYLHHKQSFKYIKDDGMVKIVFK